jgi:DUF971 family protein
MAEIFSLHVISIGNRANSGLLDIEWSDGRQQQFTHASLRVQCKCADCKVAPPREDVLDSTTLRLDEIRPVGTYGVQLIFNDGHNRGIYPWQYLYSLDSLTDS